MKTRSLAGAVLLMGIMMAGQNSFGIGRKKKAAVPVPPDTPAQVFLDNSAGNTNKQDNESYRYLQQAQDQYRYGDLAEASRLVERALAEDKESLPALSFQQKIQVVSQRMSTARAKLAEEYYDNAERLYRKNSIPYALIFAKKAVQLNPKSQEANEFLLTLAKLGQNTIEGISGPDKKPLDKGIACFMKEDYAEAERIFRRLQPAYPEVNDFLSVASFHAMDVKNHERSREYFEKATQSFSHYRFKSAQDELFLALEMDRFNIDARMMLEQVNFELGI